MTCLVVASPSIAQQVRVITGDIEHIYGPGGVVLDDAELRARNERAFERTQLEKQRAIEGQQIDADEAALAYAPVPTWDSAYGGGFFVDRHRLHGRIGVPLRIGGSPRMGNSRR